MISLLDLIGSLSAGVALCLLFSKWRRQLASAEKWIIFFVCLLTLIINFIGFISWLGTTADSQIAENWGDYLQILQPALWGMFFYVVVESAQSKKLKSSEEKLRAVIENLPLALHAYDQDGRPLAWNKQAETLSGYSKEEILKNTSALALLYPDAKDQQSLLQECQKGGAKYYHRLRKLRGKLGEREVAWYNISKQFPIPGWANWCIGLDMTEQLNAQRKLEHLATHDELTGLANRTLLRDRLQHALDNCIRNDHMGALMMLDLDHFKMVNDSHGHPVGDRLLVEVAKRLTSCLKSTDTLARFSGDEFVILLEEISSIEDATFVAERILNTLSHPAFVIYGNEIRVRASAGITCFPEDDIRTDELMKNMDLALYTAKEKGRNNFHLYSRNMHRRLRRRHEISEKLRIAIDQQRLELHYQPKVSLKTNKVVGFEALLRWPLPQENALHPSEFVPIAENAGLMPVLGSWVLGEAFKQTALWQNSHMQAPVAINLSALQFFQADLHYNLDRELEMAGLNAEHIELEITETAVMRNIDHAISTMKVLREKGFSISLDDFGTGYSSLSWLKRFPINTIKIDQSFISELQYNSQDAAIVRSIIQLGHCLDKNIVAEGVENEKQKIFLADENCDAYQGFLYCKPLAAETLSQTLAPPIH